MSKKKRYYLASTSEMHAMTILSSITPRMQRKPVPNLCKIIKQKCAVRVPL